MTTGETIALLSLIFGFLGYAGGRLSASKDEGKEDGIVAQKLDGLTNTINAMQKQIDKITARMENQVDQLQKDLNEMRERVAALEVILPQAKK